MVMVNQILTAKGSDVFTLSPEASGLDAVGALAQHNIGALIVATPDRVIQGIISERDVVRVLAKGGQEALGRPVSEMMTTNVRTCSEDASVPEVMAIMTQGRFRHLPVERDGKLVGVVSIGDVVKHRIAEIEREAEDIRSYISAA